MENQCKLGPAATEQRQVDVAQMLSAKQGSSKCLLVWRGQGLNPRPPNEADALIEPTHIGHCFYDFIFFWV